MFKFIDRFFDFIDRWIDEWLEKRDRNFEWKVRMIVYKMEHENDDPLPSVSPSPEYKDERGIPYDPPSPSWSPSPSPELREWRKQQRRK